MTSPGRPEEDLVHHFGRFAAAVQFDDLPIEAVEAAKKSILDTLGVIMAASGLEPAARPVVDLVRESAGKPEATVLAFGGRVPADQAAFANGAMAHCLDFDDQTPWGQHSASSIVPAVLAVAERRGGVSGRDLIAAVAVGQDMFARLRRNVAWRKDWNLSSVLGVFAATAAAGRVLVLSADQLTNALGIASMQSSGVMEVVAGAGSDLRGMYAGFSAKGAVLATLLAAKGLTGVAAPLRGPVRHLRHLLPRRLRPRGDARPGSERTSPGRAPCTSHGPRSARRTATSTPRCSSSRHRLAADDIAEIRVHRRRLPRADVHAAGRASEPADSHRRRFSLPFLVAVAAVRRRVGIADFSSGGPGRPHRPGDSAQGRARARSRVELDTRASSRASGDSHVDGRTYRRTGDGVPGTAEAPLSWDDILVKFRDCAAASINPPSPKQLAAVEQHFRSLEESRDAAAMLPVLSGRGTLPSPSRR